MFIALNCGIIALILLIAYWWANQGLFSAILHLMAVIAAGAIALAFWEPVTMRFLLRGNAFDRYAWGVTLVVLFVASLLVIRVALDKLIPGNVNMPNWANYAFGFPVGAAAGIITIGILVTGAGFLQSHREMLGYVGWWRDPGTAQITRHEKSMWLPVHEWTCAFYSRLSAGALSTRTPLHEYQPDLYQQASLFRDTFEDGRGQTTMQPEDAAVDQLLRCVNRDRYIVGMRFTTGARDYGEQLTLSRSQVRLLCRGDGGGDAPVVFPDQWTQDTGRFPFDDASHYVSSVPGREETDVAFEFAVPAGVTPRFIQVRNIRYRLPAPDDLDCQALIPDNSLAGGDIEALFGGSIQTVIQVSDSIRPVKASSNDLPGRFEVVGQRLAEGEGKFIIGKQGRIAQSLAVKGIYTPKGTQVVQLNVSRGGPADIFTASGQMNRGDELRLMDSNGNSYSCIGYMHTRMDGVMIKLAPERFFRTISELPQLPSSGTHELKLLFSVTDGANIIAFDWGDVTVGTCTLKVLGKADRG